MEVRYYPSSPPSLPSAQYIMVLTEEEYRIIRHTLMGRIDMPRYVTYGKTEEVLV